MGKIPRGRLSRGGCSGCLTLGQRFVCNKKKGADGGKSDRSRVGDRIP